ncbi:endonuclease/exonuclease/phosphatase family protein [Altererythrobacter sp. MF3-039]|uniref:endonuclease/exonuclease/phosphatase family protein n=1 Tax=Altererythrobacter sp. MF3-039 TaxID=3252901 RepID=UPI00390C5368
MKKLVSTLVGATALFAAHASASAEELSIATLNTEFLITDKIHISRGFDFRLSEAEKAEWPDTRRAQVFDEKANAIAAVLANVDADILVLTEIGDGPDFDKIKSALSNAGLNYPHAEICDCNDPTGQNVAIFSRLPLSSVEAKIEGREHYLAEDDDPGTEGDTGLSKGLKATVSFQGQEIVIYGVHLKSERGFSEADGQRIAQASIVRRNYLKDLDAGRHVIVVGDLNDRRGDPTLKRIRGLDDIQPDLIQTGLYNFFEESERGERWTYIYQGRRQQIDHILVSDSLKPMLKRTKGIKSRVERITDSEVTDHSALIVTLDFR